jgi:hypothetical protein
LTIAYFWRKNDSAATCLELITSNINYQTWIMQ